MSDSMPQPAADERLKTESFGARLMKRPELGAIAGVILVTIFFLVTADPAMFTLSGVINFMTPAAQLGILAIGSRDPARFHPGKGTDFLRRLGEVVSRTLQVMLEPGA